MQKPLLSICIPTYNRIEILRNTINSIYAQAEDDDITLFEIVISDNSTNHSCQALENDYSRYGNFHYHITTCEGFLNSFYALTYGNGNYLKLHNNTAILKDGALTHMLNLVRNTIDSKPLLFFSDGYKLNGKIHQYEAFEDFMADASYFTSWSNGFGIWREDFEQVRDCELNKYFPQTSLIATQYYKKRFVVDDTNLFETQNVPQKGGYNIFKAFSIDYLNIIQSLNVKGIISEKCFQNIKYSLLYKFLSVRYFKTIIAKMDKFDYSNLKQHMLTHYSEKDYIKFKIASIWGPFRFLIREYYRNHFTGIKNNSL